MATELAGLSNVSPYDAIASYYDLEHKDFDDDIAMLRNIVEIVGDPVLEFGCGSGRILLPLAAEGFSITGVDTSETMLKRARDTIDTCPESGKVTLVHADFRDRLPLPEDHFGVGIFSLNSLLHLVSRSDQLAALTEACRVLDPRGQLVIDMFNPTPEYLAHMGSGTHFEGAWLDGDGQEIEKWSHCTLHPARQIIETRLWYDVVGSDGTVERKKSAFGLRYIHASELELLLEKAGFAEWQLYGSYDLDPFDDASDRLIALAEKTSLQHP